MRGKKYPAYLLVRGFHLVSNGLFPVVRIRDPGLSVSSSLRNALSPNPFFSEGGIGSAEEGIYLPHGPILRSMDNLIDVEHRKASPVKVRDHLLKEGCSGYERKKTQLALNNPARVKMVDVTFEDFHLISLNVNLEELRGLT